jgi:hypothetical protein
LTALWLMVMLGARASAQAQSPPGAGPPVGRLGNPILLRLQGCQVIPAQEVRAAILLDASIELAATPSAPLGRYLSVLESQLVAGYQSSGFPDATVRVEIDPDGNAITAQITEGPRYAAGPVTINGANHLDVARLVRSLTTPPAPDEVPVNISWKTGIAIPAYRDQDPSKHATWEADKPARFDFQSRMAQQNAVQCAAAAQGYFWAKVNTSIGRIDNKAILVVDFTDEGPKAVLAGVEFHGLVKNTSDDLMRFLELEEGQSMDLKWLRAIQRRLYLSGRFYDHQLNAQVHVGQPGKLTLGLTLEECGLAPPVRVALSPEEQAILKFRDWLVSQRHEKADAILDFGVTNDAGWRTEVKAVFNPAKGLAVRASFASTRPTALPAGTTLPAEALSMAGVLTSGTWGLYVPTLHHKCVAPVGTEAWAPTFTFKIEPDPRALADSPTKVHLLFGASVEARKNGAPVRLDLSLAPVCFMFWLRSPETRDAAVRDGVLSYRKGDVVFRIDATSGRLLDVTGPTVSFSLSHAEGALEREAQSLEAENPCPNNYDPKFAGASALSFGYSHLLLVPQVRAGLTPEQRARAVSAIGKLLSPQLLAALYEPALPPQPDKDSTFGIPPDIAIMLGNGDPLSLVTLFVPFVNFACERGEWPWTLARQAIMLYARHGEHFSGEMNRVLNLPNTGPLGHYAAAELCAWAAPDGAAAVARRALAPAVFDEERFIAESRFLLRDGSVLAATVTQLVRNLQGMDASEIDALRTALGATAGEALHGLWLVVQAHRNDPPGMMMDAIEKDYWNGGLKAALEARLKQIAELPAPARQAP